MLGELESELEKTASAVEAAEHNFDDVMLVGGKNKKKVSRSEKREARYNHAKTQSIVRSGFNLETRIMEASGRRSYILYKS